MSKITSPAISVNLGEQEYEFRLDFTAMADFEKATGKGVLELFGEVFSTLQGANADNAGALLAGLRLKATDLQALTWACLGGEDSGITLREAGRLIHAGNLQEVIAALAEALRSALPEATPEDKQSLPLPLPGRDGSDSGASEDNPSD